MEERRKLTEKQRRFVEAYLGEARGNATEAARIAGYKGNERTLQVVGSQNLSKPIVSDAIRERTERDDLVMTREELQRFWSKVTRGDEFAEMRDRLKASELLGKTQSAFVQRV